MIEPFGAILTFGAHKGYGMAVLCELLGGALAAGMTQHSDDTSKKRVLNGMLTVLIDPARSPTGRPTNARRRLRRLGHRVTAARRLRPRAPGRRARARGSRERTEKAYRWMPPHGRRSSTRRKLGVDPASVKAAAGQA